MKIETGGLYLPVEVEDGGLFEARVVDQGPDGPDHARNIVYQGPKVTAEFVAAAINAYKPKPSNSSLIPIDFSTEEYEQVHGRKPRGEGTWGFFFDQQNDINQVYWQHNTFSGAKRAAIQRARKLGHTVVRVAT